MKGLRLTLNVAVLLFAGVLVFHIVNNQPVFIGERIKNPDSYKLDIQRMNGNDYHTLKLTTGDVLQVEFETRKGFLHMEITAPDDTAVYTGNGEEAKTFEINISESGTYSIAVEARHAKGKINIQAKEDLK